MSPSTQAAVNVFVASSAPALQSKTRRGLTLDRIRLGSLRSAQARRRLFDEAYAHVSPIIFELRDAGYSQTQISEIMAMNGHTTRNRAPFCQSFVRRILKRRGS